MTAGSAERTVAASPERVFARLSDPDSWSEWLPGHGGWPEGVPASVGEGEIFTMRLGFFGIHDTVTVTVEENRAPSALVFLAEGNYGASARMSFRLTPGEHDGTVVRAEVEVIGTPVRVVASLANRALTKTLGSALRELADQTETNPGNQPRNERNHHVLFL